MMLTCDRMVVLSRLGGAALQERGPYIPIRAKASVSPIVSAWFLAVAIFKTQGR